MLRVKDIQKDLGLGITTTYKLVNTKGFPKITINGRMYIPEEEYRKWIKMHIGKKILV